MEPINTPITGAERPLDDNTPMQALTEFYRAFNQKSLTLMASNWSQSVQASMSNPLGGVKRGWEEIRAVYEKIFHGPADVYVEFFDYSIQQRADMFCAVGRERGRLSLSGAEIQLAIRTSRIYLREAGRWRQLHHHGSMDNPQSLGEYQAAVLRHL